MIIVYVRNNDVPGALRELKKRIKKSGIMEELKAREYFVPKGEKRRAKSIAARRRK